MVISGQRLLVAVSILLGAIAVVLWTRPQLASGQSLAVVALCALAAGVVLNVIRPPRPASRREPDDIGAIDDERRAELMRGTSLFLRESRYRYSVRLDRNAGGDRRGFTAEVNTIRLGFIPAVITDNTTDRQGLGYVAFVHDGKRWRGPGLPCPADEAEAVRHAARCVSPLTKDEEMDSEGT